MLRPKLSTDLQAARYSPHLVTVVHRHFGEIDRHAIFSAFLTALDAGGFDEIDFIRTAGSSFNPRPARTGLILINDARVRDAEIVSAGILSAIGKPLAAKVSQDFTARVNELVTVSLLPASDLLNRPELPSAVAQIAGSRFLDRARHIHQAPPSHQRSIANALIAEAEALERLTMGVSGPLYLLIRAWRERFPARLDRLRGEFKE